MADNNLLGCVLEKDYTLESDEIISQSTGESVLWRVSASSFHGRWQELVSRGVTGVFLWRQYEKFLKYVPHHQRRGTCVSRGFQRALQASYLSSLGKMLAVGNPIEIAYEPIYAGSRVIVGKGRLGSSDGSVGAWAGQYLALFGANERGVYGSADLTKSNEDWACEYGKPGRVMPAGLLEHARSHTCAVHRLQTIDEFADSIASDFGVARCWDTLFGKRDSNGMARASDTGAHCQAVIGVFLQPNGRLGFVEAQSWGPNMPSGPNILKTAGGDIELPPGCYGVDSGEYERAMSKSRKWWEAHAVTIRTGQEWN